MLWHSKKNIWVWRIRQQFVLGGLREEKREVLQLDPWRSCCRVRESSDPATHPRSPWWEQQQAVMVGLQFRTTRAAFRVPAPKSPRTTSGRGTRNSPLQNMIKNLHTLAAS
ncbi:hypothetical protein CDAR_62981 [Caerostris darwini]|uniref:Uncharacterized protein n=1 Tax=Caerostris darwini TaxID=1538125 RepID=A0AAV4UF74_9ARAC|nr:hypothetical protein CDAR_62981 [Caerostris darwini]